MIKKMVVSLLMTFSLTFLSSSFSSEHFSPGHLLGSINFPTQEQSFYVGDVQISQRTGTLYATAGLTETEDIDNREDQIWFSPSGETKVTQGDIKGLPGLALLKNFVLDDKRTIFFTCQNSLSGIQRGIAIYIKGFSKSFTHSRDIPIHNGELSCNGLVLLDKTLIISNENSEHNTDVVLSTIDTSSGSAGMPDRTTTLLSEQRLVEENDGEDTQIISMTQKKNSTNSVILLIKTNNHYKMTACDTNTGELSQKYDINMTNTSGTPLKIIDYGENWYILMTEKGVWLEKIDDLGAQEPLLITPPQRNMIIHTISIGRDRFSITKDPVLFVSLSTITKKGKSHSKINEYHIQLPTKKNQQTQSIDS